MPLGAVDLGRQPKSFKGSPHIEVTFWPGDVGQFSLKRNELCIQEMNDLKVKMADSSMCVVKWELPLDLFQVYKNWCE